LRGPFSEARDDVSAGSDHVGRQPGNDRDGDAREDAGDEEGEVE